MRDGISLLMIARNEESLIGSSLRSLSPYVNEMIVGDTGSSDNTVSVSRAAGAKTVFIPWEGDFSKARNHLIEHASYRWILFVDADETLKKGSADLLKNTADLSGVSAFMVRFEDATDEGSFRTYSLPRLFLNTPEIRYKNCVHETITSSLETILAEKRMEVKRSEITLLHTGYLKSEIERKETLSRNILLLERASRENPDDIFILLKYGDNLSLLKRESEALNVLYRAIALLKERDEGNMPEIYSSLTTLLIRRGELSGAERILKECAFLKCHISLLYNMGLIHWKKGSLREALFSYLAAEELLLKGVEDPDGMRPFILNSIGELYLKLKSADEAESYFSRAFDSAPKMLNPVFNLMRVSIERGDLKMARRYISECERISPENPAVTRAKKAVIQSE